MIAFNRKEGDQKMSIDTSLLRYIEDNEWRVMTAVEMGMRNHEYVSPELVASIAGLRGTIHHHLQNLSRHKLIHHEGKPYDGYTLTKIGYDFLALHSLVKRGVISTFGSILGRGKEADVFVAYDEDDNPLVLKFHRIGRVSFRKAKDTRDYLSKKHAGSWLYLSRLSAQREFRNLKALQDFPVPRVIDWNRHCTVMSYVSGTLLNGVQELSNPERTFHQILDLAVALLKGGVIHADFSEFNIIVGEDEEITLIDFPQCMEYTDPEAPEKFNHDIDELGRFFGVRYDLHFDRLPRFEDYVNEIIPITLEPARTAENAGVEGEGGEEEDDGDGEGDEVQMRVSKEKRLRRKVVKKNKTKQKTYLNYEAKTYQ